MKMLPACPIDLRRSAAWCSVCALMQARKMATLFSCPPFVYSAPMPEFPAPVVRQAAPADLDALVHLEQASFPGDRLSRRQYRHHLGSASACILVAECGTQDLAGALVLLFRRGTRVARVYSLATAAAMRGRGIASHLLTAAETVAREHGCRAMRLEVRSDNAAAIALYRRAGYRPIGTRANYYEDGADAWRFEKSLQPAIARATGK
ncbi:MAG TPA: N-acetyltransferase [Rhodanobacteraceae bacterium]|nr:N-acetyltransferase [Rhodanobacteraceae bacterium]